jgi:colanic acid/amylovoran biosynthesis glycosyltransferase
VNPPKTAYVLLWFPKPSETFVFREVMNLRKMGLPLKVYTLYGELTSGMSDEMRSVSRDVERLGIPFLRHLGPDFLFWWRRDRDRVSKLMKSFVLRRWSGLEKTGENLWAFMAGFRLARRFEEEGIEHIHAPWASGPATAAWISSRLTGIPFSFTARAWDIYPADAVLPDKIRDAAFVRSETATNIPYLGGFVGGDTSKIHLTYNGVPLQAHREAPVPMKAPFKLLALGRFVGKKGYDYLLQACRILVDSGVDFHLTLAGDGPRSMQLKHLANKLGVSDKVSFPGFVNYDAVSDLISSSDLLVMPSVVHSSGDRDGIPTVIMEALMHRVPVIATDVSGIAEVIEDAATGLLIPEKNPAAIAAAVRKMTQDREFALATAERGREKVRKQFDPDLNHTKVLNLYTQLLGKPEHPEGRENPPAG